ncbi:MAG: hypothetical protein EZS28_038107 [Streblomastix strix]|uniref:Uncharacterized protein n=1 Tax=Streblomastix strix TaxID=222440 RepID=A0A5J4U698_9EUKA|nr:MAG: hypothetical protein EZS28_038107 [Streblomastix strix]
MNLESDTKNCVSSVKDMLDIISETNFRNHKKNRGGGCLISAEIVPTMEMQPKGASLFIEIHRSDTIYFAVFNLTMHYQTFDAYESSARLTA